MIFKKIFVFTFFFIISASVNAQEPDDDFDADSAAMAESSYFEDELFLEDKLLMDSLAIAFNDWFFSRPTVIYNFKAPASDIYKIWDTLLVRPYTIDVTKMIDSVEIILQDNYKNKFFNPVNGIVTSRFGFRKHRYHYGTDIDLETGDSVSSAFDGMVRVVKYSKGYGNVIVVRHYNGLETVYGHLSQSLVKTNQIVKAGSVLGLGGNTGRSFGSHLHFETRYLGQPINPESFISFENKKLTKNSIIISKKTFAYSTSSPGSKGGSYHIVKKGDSLGKIARKYGTTVARLCKLNRIKSTTKLRIGMRLRTR
ncbi:MAG: M23 family metallopeptidase [Bacteroidota bacterium]